MAAHDGASAAGWYGKLPSLGDFASRRLDPGFIETWDLWLAEGLAAWRGREPATWLERYLASPSWRFVLAPSALPLPAGSGCWAGVLMPSVDRVGRYFPLTLALRLPALPATPGAVGALLSWLQRLNDLALDALDEDWTAERLETELLRLGGPAPATPEWTDPAHAPGLGRLAPGQACWMHGDAHGALRAHTREGMPRGTDFDALLGARVPPAGEG
ncbi:hypothetical protein ASF44_18955 [Pseudorhodoferax sp. Leaf274]|nr:hypothetical protein ASF44_18955 [Pseudorhodoferax sp. Leaf274]